jgi:aspartyl-tRNA(Asn)/glutamyl-tRNA(Gln) amidotransferase subunit A
MSEPRELTIVDAVNRLRKGELTAEALVVSCLERIHRRDGAVRAWVEVYEEQALEEARECDAGFRAGKWSGELHGIPIGVKDIIDVKGMWTKAGCPVYPPRVAESDAPAVKRLRDAGAVILGKTETTAFANNDPTVTCNPWNTGHTPGGSSSGSGAAVADRMCLAALGTQTGGSVLRPAAYNGVVGVKPTYASISTEGVIPVSWTLDHVGSFARNVQDSKILFGVLRDPHPDPFARTPAGSHHHDEQDRGARFRLGYFRQFAAAKAAVTVIEHLDVVLKTFEAAGMEIIELDFEGFERAASAHRTIMDAELAAYHRTLFDSKGDQYPPNIKARIEKGLTIPGVHYIEAVHQRIAFQDAFGEALSGVDAAILPAAPTTVPKGLASTGSPVFCVPWSISGFPAITLPSGLDEQGLPLALLIGSGPMDEEKLFAVAAGCERLLSFTSSPVQRADGA